MNDQQTSSEADLMREKEQRDEVELNQNKFKQFFEGKLEANIDDAAQELYNKISQDENADENSAGLKAKVFFNEEDENAN